MPATTSRPVTTITLAYLMAILAHVRGARPASIVSVTDARCRKTDNPFGGVSKRSRTQVMINWNYANAVNNQRKREDATPDFVPEPRKWGQRLPKCPFVAHKGKLYLECKVVRSLAPPEYFVTDGGRALTADDVKPFLPPIRSNAEHQGLDTEIILRDYMVENIEIITVDGETYRIDPASIDEALRLAEAQLTAMEAQPVPA